jgi:enoyl-CoA hydratase
VAVTVERAAGAAIVTVDRPEALNALDVEHLTGLRDRLREAAADEAVRVVVLAGAGERAFMAGADVRHMRDLDVMAARGWAALGHECGGLLERMRKPTIAELHGFCLGGGCELALACDVRLAADNLRIGQPEISIGIVPGWGGSQRLARATTLGFAKDLIYTGRMVGADEALRVGLVSAVHPRAELRERTLELCATLESKSTVALAYAKELTNLPLQGDHAEHLDREADVFAMLFSTEDQKEGMGAFLEKREPRFTGR